MSPAYLSGACVMIQGQFSDRKQPQTTTTDACGAPGGREYRGSSGWVTPSVADSGARLRGSRVRRRADYARTQATHAPLCRRSSCRWQSSAICSLACNHPRRADCLKGSDAVARDAFGTLDPADTTRTTASTRGAGDK